MHKGHTGGYTHKMPQGQSKESQRTFSGSGPDAVKDNREISNILRVLDSSVIRTSPFGANLSGENSYRRAERISAALHLITNHLPEPEPLRVAIRTRGLELLAIILDLRSAFRSPASEKSHSALALIREIISLTRLLAVSGYISLQNANVIADAIDELGSLIVVSQRSSLSEQLTISRDQLIPPPVSSVGGLRAERPIQNIVKRTHQTEPAERQISNSAGSSNRADVIMDILKAGGNLGIKDISSNLPQYSEKMVQRELSDLVKNGRVQKVGFKRWSRYQIV